MSFLILYYKSTGNNKRFFISNFYREEFKIIQMQICQTCILPMVDVMEMIGKTIVCWVVFMTLGTPSHNTGSSSPQ